MIIARHVFSKQIQLQLENIDYTNLSHYNVQISQIGGPLTFHSSGAIFHIQNIGFFAVIITMLNTTIFVTRPPNP